MTSIPIEIQSRIIDNVTNLNGVKDLLLHAQDLTTKALRYPVPPHYMRATPEVIIAVSNISYLLGDDVDPFEIQHSIKVLYDLALEFPIGYLGISPLDYNRDPIKMTDETLAGSQFGVMLLGLCDILKQYYDFKTVN